MKFSIRKLVILWATLSVLLIGGYIFAQYNNSGASFFLLLNVLNAFTVVAVLTFKNKIVDISQSFSNSYQQINTNPENFEVSTRYHRELYLGYALVLITVLFGLYVTLLSASDVDAYKYLIREDGVIEYGSSFFWFLSAIILVFCIVSARASGKIFNFRSLPYLLLIVFFIICGGEEISWGQRIFDMDTSELLKRVNVQDEITLHNIGSISVFSNTFFLLTIIFFLVAPLIAMKTPNLGKLANYYAIPLPNRFVSLVFIICLIVWIFIGVRFGTLGFHPFSFYAENYYNQMDDEIFEFFAAYAFFCFSVMEFQKSTSKA